MQDDQHNIRPEKTEYVLEIQEQYPEAHQFCNIGWYGCFGSNDKLEYAQLDANRYLETAFKKRKTLDDGPGTFPGPEKVAYRIIKFTLTAEVVESKFIDNPK